MSNDFTPILIPGLLCTGDLFAGQRDRLAARSAPVVANTLGHESIAAMAMQALGATRGRVVPIGLSMGGYVAMEMARIAPERIAGLVLLNTAHRADTAARKKQREAAIGMAASARFRGVTRHLLGSLLSERALRDKVLVDRVLAMAAQVGRDNFVLQQRAIMTRRDQSDTLKGLGVPALVLCGARDVLTPPSISRRMAALAPNARLVILPDVAHLSTMEAPDAVCEAINELLEGL